MVVLHNQTLALLLCPLQRHSFIRCACRCGCYLPDLPDPYPSLCPTSRLLPTLPTYPTLPWPCPTLFYALPHSALHTRSTLPTSLSLFYSTLRYSHRFYPATTYLPTYTATATVTAIL